MKSANSLSSPVCISKYSLQLSTRLPTPIRKYLPSSSLVHIRKMFKIIWQLKNWLPSCMVSQRWMAHQLHILWNILTHPPGKHYMNSSNQMQPYFNYGTHSKRSLPGLIPRNTSMEIFELTTSWFVQIHRASPQTSKWLILIGRRR